MNPREQILELAALTQSFLLQEYGPKEWLFAEPESYLFFKQMVQSSKTAAPPSPASAALIEPVRAVVASPKPRPPLQDAPPASLPAHSQALPPTPAAEPPKEDKKALPSSKPLFELEPLAKAKPADFSELRKSIAEKLPKLRMLDTPPEIKPKVSPAGSAKVVVLANKSNTFLPSVCQAIAAQLAPSILLHPEDIEASFEALLDDSRAALLLIDDATLRAYPVLLKNYRPAESSTGAVLGRIPALVLSDVATLATDTARKRALWTTLKTFFP